MQRKDLVLLVLLGLYHALHSQRRSTVVSKSFESIVGYLSPGGSLAETLINTKEGLLSGFERECVRARLSSPGGGNGLIQAVRDRGGGHITQQYSFEVPISINVFK